MSKRSLVPGVLLAAIALGTSITDAADRSVLRVGEAVVAEVRGDHLVPLWDERTRIGFLQAGLARSQDRRLHARLEGATIQRDGERFFLVGRGRNADGQCVTPSVLLEPGGEATLATATIHFIRIETCVGTTCPASGCVAQRGEDGHIQFCYCLPAGDCEKVVLVIPVPL